MQGLHATSIAAVQTDFMPSRLLLLISSYDALTSGREILEPALVLASAADCLSADLSGEGFDMIWVPAEASSRKLRHRVVVGSFSAN